MNGNGSWMCNGFVILHEFLVGNFNLILNFVRVAKFSSIESWNGHGFFGLYLDCCDLQVWNGGTS